MLMPMRPIEVSTRDRAGGALEIVRRV